MYKMIIEYEKEADRLEKKLGELKEMIKKEQNVRKLHLLERRAELIKTERYEILRDVSDMKEHLSEWEIEEWQDRKELA